MKEVIFTDEELEYIYNHLDFDADERLFESIENKIRKQIKRYYLVDNK